MLIAVESLLHLTLRVFWLHSLQSGQEGYHTVAATVQARTLRVELWLNGLKKAVKKDGEYYATDEYGDTVPDRYLETPYRAVKLRSKALIPLDAWTHVAFVFARGAVRMWRNGGLEPVFLVVSRWFLFSFADRVTLWLLRSRRRADHGAHVQDRCDLPSSYFAFTHGHSNRSCAGEEVKELPERSLFQTPVEYQATLWLGNKSGYSNHSLGGAVSDVSLALLPS